MQAEVGKLRSNASRNKVSKIASNNDECAALQANLELHRDALNVSQSELGKLKGNIKALEEKNSVRFRSTIETQNFQILSTGIRT